MHLFYTPEIEPFFELPLEEAQHCVRVLRMKPGDEIRLTDGKGYFYVAVIRDVNPKHCQVEIIDTQLQVLPWPAPIHVGIAPTKNMERMEWLIEKLTEVGIDRISFIHCRNSERKEMKPERIMKIVVSAMKQSEKATLPEIGKMTGFQSFIGFQKEEQKFIAHCMDGEKSYLGTVYRKNKGGVLILIGPEGDFNEEELEGAQQAGFISVSLGESRLRTETAALMACQTIHVVNRMEEVR